MTNALEMQVEELRAELGHCDPAERQQIAAELEQARAELKAAITAQEGAIDAEPPFLGWLCRLAKPGPPDRPANQAHFASASVPSSSFRALR